MLIAYYTDSEGKIVNFHDCKGATMEDMLASVERYNAVSAEREGAKFAHVEKVPDGGLTAYLYARARERISANKEEIQNIIYDIDSLREAIEGLVY